MGLLAPSAWPTPLEESCPKLWYHLPCPTPMCTILSSLGNPKALLVPQGFVLPTWHQAFGTRPYAHQGRAPLMNQALNTHLSDVGLLAPSASPTPSEGSRSRLWYHLLCPTPMCMILSSLGGLKSFLVLHGFVLLTWRQASWEKASCTSRESTSYESGSRHSLKLL